MKHFFLLFSLLVGSFAIAQIDSAKIVTEALAFQKELDSSYADPEHDRMHFEGLPFFEIDPKFCVEAKFKKAKKPRIFEMETTTDRLPVYDV